MINPTNIIAYLKYLELRINKKFSEDSFNHWVSIDTKEINETLQVIYERNGITKEESINFENNFLYDIKQMELYSTSSNIIPLLTTEVVKTPPLYITNLEPIETIENIVVTKNEVTKEEVIQEENNETENINNNNIDNNYPLKKQRKKFGFIKWILILGILTTATVFGYKYYQFTKLKTAYSLADNLAIHSSNDDVSPVINRLDLFSSFLKPNGTVTPSLNELKIVEKVGVYSKVMLVESFEKYLFGGQDNFGYIHNKFITEDYKEYKKFKTVFNELKSDYNELDKLQFNYRKAIVTAVNEFTVLNNLKVATPCFKESKISNNAALSILQYNEKDELNNIKNIYMTLQMSDDKFYTIKANKDGTVISNVWSTEINEPVSNIFLDGTNLSVDLNISNWFDNTNNDRKNKPLTYKGKFKLDGKQAIFTNCAGDIKAKSNTLPYNIFSKN